MIIESGSPLTLGAHYNGEGTNFALFSAHAEQVELCLYDADGKSQLERFPLPEKEHDIWHGYLPGVGPEVTYGYRVYGPYEPQQGHRFNGNKMLLDPYARAFAGTFTWHDSHFGFVQGDVAQDLSFDERDNSSYMPKARITVAENQHACYSSRPIVPWQQTVVYESHVKGFTCLHPALPESLQGTFAGMSQDHIISYLKALGITSVELLPIHAFIDEHFLHKLNLSNYWGYNSLNFFTPHPAYLSGRENEFRECVDRFHDAGLEVILDVVFNHTCEGSHLGPTVSYRGIDNASYYQLMPSDKRFYINDSGCGNTLNIGHPRVLQLVMDSLRFWAGEMAVDGFRFDLASIMGRTASGYNPRATFFQIIAQDPVLSTCKFIAEPWDLGPGGYQLGSFPAGWSEWNDRYRDTVRRFWRGDNGELPELARRLHGSGDIFEHAGRRPSASINFVSSHDGFTLRDLVSYRHRHNEANLENNNDGHRENLSHNFGVEGETEDAHINAQRWRQQRNFLTTLILSQGVPMIVAGDELGRSQGGNNNAYCQDNAINWLDWHNVSAEGRALCRFTAALLHLRNAFPVLQAIRYRHLPDSPDDDSIQWLNSDGKPMSESHWHERDNHVLGFLLTERQGNDQSNVSYLLILFNAGEHGQQFTLPPCGELPWSLIIDTYEEKLFEPVNTGDHNEVELSPTSMKVLIAGDVPDLTVCCPLPENFYE